jgi:hypothetical protein
MESTDAATVGDEDMATAHSAGAEEKKSDGGVVTARPVFGSRAGARLAAFLRLCPAGP